MEGEEKMDNGYLLMVEDDPLVQEKNKTMLERRGYKVRQAFTIAEARAAIAQEVPRVIILDIGLPDGSGLTFLQEIRETSTIPVLMLTAMGTPEDKVRGLTTGSDDYLAKPYDFDEFLVRIDALLRRASIIPETLVIGQLRLDTTSGTAFLSGEDMMLSKKEYSLLQLFMQQPDKVMGAEYVYEKVWGQDMLDNTEAFRAAVHRLRKKLEDSGYTITFERGEGYMFEKV